MVNIIINGQETSVEEGTSLLELSNFYREDFKTRIVGAYVDNSLRDLYYKIKFPCTVEFLELATADGMRMYIRTLSFIFNTAVEEIFHDKYGEILHSISDGLYCKISDKTPITKEVVKKISNKMQEIIDEDWKFQVKDLEKQEIRSVFIKSKREHLLEIFERDKSFKRKFYQAGKYIDCYFGPLLPSTGYIHLFELLPYSDGMIMRFPTIEKPYEIPQYEDNPKLFSVFKEHKEWGQIMQVENVGMLNNFNKKGKIGNIIRVSEALQEKKIANIADMICADKNKKIILIAGPSSSGKTTFAQRLAVQLRVNGKKPVMISLDNYFVDRKFTPLDENGEYDFEAIEAINVEQFNSHLKDLLDGKVVTLPVFDFTYGRQIIDEKNAVKINDDTILIIEGIHGLNDALTPSIDKKNKFKIYISALTSLNIDEHNRIPTTDTRFIRRIVRDNAFRNYSASSTIQRWPSVRRGEERNIFPFQEEADVMFNSAMVYELGVLKVYAEPILEAIEHNDVEYREARRLINLLEYFLPIRADEVPITSILREFIGNGCFTR